MIFCFEQKTQIRNSILLSVCFLVLLVGFQSGFADIENIKDVAFPRKSLIKGACLEFRHDPYILDRLAQYDLIVGSSLYPEYWLENEGRDRFLAHQMAALNIRNDRIVMLATLFFPFKIWGGGSQCT